MCALMTTMVELQYFVVKEHAAQSDRASDNVDAARQYRKRKRDLRIMGEHPTDAVLLRAMDCSEELKDWYVWLCFCFWPTAALFCCL